MHLEKIEKVTHYKREKEKKELQNTIMTITKVKHNPKVIKVLTHLNRRIENWGSITSTDFTLFTREFKSMIISELNKVGGIDYKQMNGHYYISGFFTLNNQPYYISISDVRYFTIDNILIRTAKDYKDYTGGINNYIPIETDMFLNYFKKIK